MGKTILKLTKQDQLMKGGHRSTESNGLISPKTTDRLNTLTKITDKSSCSMKTDQRTKTTQERQTIKRTKTIERSQTNFVGEKD